jgi:hypothetical protein
MIDKILSEYVNHNGKERKVGRYYSSEIGQIVKGYFKPEQFFIKKKIDKKGVGNILSGMSFEAELKRALDFSKVKYTHEPKKELQIDDFVIVVKPDFEFEDKILETKFPVSLGNPADYLERYKHQLELQHRVFKKDLYLGIFSHPFTLKTYKYQPSDDTYEEIIKAVKKFHLCLTKISTKE